jgi:hypothetical protein
MGNNPNSTGFYMSLPDSVMDLNEAQRDRLLGEAAKKYIIAEPGTFVLRTIKKAALLHFGETIAVHWNAEGIKRRLGESFLYPLKLINQLFWTVTLLLAILGLVMMIFTQGIVLSLVNPVVIIWIYFTAIYSVTTIQDRYHFPSHPFIAILAAIAILTFVKRPRFRSLYLSEVIRIPKHSMKQKA